MTKKTNKYPHEVCERAVRMVLETKNELLDWTKF
jgi:hypothetical protein